MKRANDPNDLQFDLDHVQIKTGTTFGVVPALLLIELSTLHSLLL